MKTANEIIENFVGQAVKFEGNSNDGYGVLVKDVNSDFKAWIDVIVDGNDVSTDWNQYIFHLDNANDVLQRDVQNDCNVFMDCCSTAVSFLEEINKIFQDENGEWFYNVSE